MKLIIYILLLVNVIYLQVAICMKANGRMEKKMVFVLAILFLPVRSIICGLQYNSHICRTGI